MASAIVGLVAGWIAGRLGRRRAGSSRAEADGHRIRSMEAELRVVRRKAEEAELALERTREQAEALARDLEAARRQVTERDGHLAELDRRLEAECAKTQALREELVQRAEETIRAGAKIRDAETELSVAKAGSDAVMEQVQRLAAEREELTGRLRTLEAVAAGRPPKVTWLPPRDPKDR